MAYDLELQISKLPQIKEASVQALIDCATEFLSKDGTSPSCQSISHLGSGSFNRVYQLVFDNGIELAASVSYYPQTLFDAEVRESGIAAMKFVRESGLYPGFIVPKVHAWDASYNNPVGAPYILMDVVSGVTVKLESLTHSQQLSVIKALAKLKAMLSKPVPFSKIADTSGGHTVGPLLDLGETGIGPFGSMHELWYSVLQQDMLKAVQEWSSHEKEEVKDEFWHPHCTPHTFAELVQLLSSLVPYFKLPKTHDHFVPHYPDLALRNVLFDQESLSSAEPQIIGVVDWDGAHVLPFMFSASYPCDLETEGDDPYEHPTSPKASTGHPFLSTGHALVAPNIGQDISVKANQWT